MSDQKQDQQDDIVTSVEDAPEAISEGKLEDVKGGLSLNFAKTRLSTTSKLDTGINADTIYSGVGNDTINADFSSIINPDSMLKR